MSHIVNFEIGGLVGRKSVYKKNLNRDVNVFFGLNGSGKTSLLRILHSAMACKTEMLEDVPFDYAEVTIHSRNHKTDYIRRIDKREEFLNSLVPESQKLRPKETVLFEREMERVRIRRPKKEKFVWTTEPLEPKDVGNANWAHGYLPTWRLYGRGNVQMFAMQQIRTGVEEYEFDWDRLFAERLEMLWSRYTTNLLSEIRKIQESGFENILGTILSPVGKGRKTVKLGALDAETAYKKVRAFLSHRGSKRQLESQENFIRHYNNNPQLMSVVREINTVEQQTEKAMSSRDALEELICKMFSGNKTLRFADAGISVKSDDGEAIGVTSLSSGEKHVLGIFIETLFAESNSLLIDEPEISLHVDWQRMLISSMSQLNPSVQLILTTHSPEIMAEVPDNRIFTL
jgi:predicted ATP-dependent endonuclease of OLD family